MFKYITRFFAIIGFFLTLSIALGAYSTYRLIQSSEALPDAPDQMVLHLDFSVPVVEENASIPASLSSLFTDGEGGVSILEIMRAIDRAKKDPKVKGIVATFGGDEPNLAQIQEIRDAIARFKESGKFTYAFATSYGEFSGGNRAYYLASAFDTIWLQPVGSLGLTSLGLEAPFGKTALEKIGVQADFRRREEYKSMMENMMQDGFSEPVKANMTALLQSFENQFVQGIATSRKMEPAKVRDLMANGPYTAKQALETGLVNHLGYRDDLEKEVKDKVGKDTSFVYTDEYLAYATPKTDEPKSTFALIHGVGMIAEQGGGNPIQGSDGILDSETIAAAFQDAVEDKEVKAILFRIDSPGGSPSASETIRHALVKAQEAKKPVFVSMGEVAASGGYWIAMNADRIVAEPATITGSIGVIVGKFVLGPLWEKLGIKWERLQTGDNAHLLSHLAPFNEKEKKKIDALLDDTYQTFTSHLSAARKIPPEKIADVAKGRVFTGEQALALGLVDELGGVHTTLAAMKKHLGLAPEDRVFLRAFPAPETPMEYILNILKTLGMQAAFTSHFFTTLQPILPHLTSAIQESTTTGLLRTKLPMGVGEMVR